MNETKLTKEEIQLLINCLEVTPTRNLESARLLIALKDKLEKMLVE